MTRNELLAEYRDMLDEIHADYAVSGITFTASRVLEELDPIAFRCGFDDWLDAEGIDLDEIEE